MATPKTYSRTSVTTRRSDVTDARPWSMATFGQAICWAVEDLLLGHGGEKNVVEWFAGRDGEAVDLSTISRWKNGARRFPAVFLPVLVAKHVGFRAFVFQYLGAQMTVPSDLAAQMSPKAADELRVAVQRQVMRPLWPDVTPKRGRR